MLEFKDVNVVTGNLDIVKKKGRVGLEIDMAQLLATHEQLEQWASLETPLVVTMTPRPLLPASLGVTES